MQKSTIITLIVLFVLASVAYSAYNYIQNKKDSTVDTQGYLQAKATITAVYPVRITRYGAKQPRYDIQFTDQSGNEQKKFRCALGGSYKVNDTVVIMYHPDKPEADVVVKSK